MSSEQDSTRASRMRKVALYGPVVVGFVLAVATGEFLSPYTDGLIFPGMLLGFVWVMLGGEVGEVIVARYDL